VHIESDGSGLSSAWLLESCTVQRADDTSGWWFFPHGRWIGLSRQAHAADPDSGVTATQVRLAAEWHVASHAAHEYRVEVTTADSMGAGTDASVYVRLTGELGHSPRLRLDNAADNFERGKVDVFVVRTPRLGKLTQAELHCDGHGPTPAWCCETLVVTEEPDDTLSPRGVLEAVTTTFHFGTWFDGKGKETDWTQRRAPSAAPPPPSPDE